MHITRLYHGAPIEDDLEVGWSALAGSDRNF